MPEFGPFKTAAEAVFAACPFILSKPHAVAGRRDDPNFDTYFRVSTEYCSLLYYTPDGKFEMSTLGTEYAQNDPEARHCPYISRVDDPRYAGDSLAYIYFLHSHVYEEELSDKDIRAIVALGREHGFEAMVQGKTARLGIIAFFSTGSYDNPTCDGFFEYIPITGKMSRWTVKDGQWTPDSYADVIWTSPDDYIIKRKL
jgi:hypothetical protein